MTAWIWIYWISVLVLVYAYIGYPLLLRLFSLFRKRKKSAALFNFPEVTLLVTAYNEEEVIEEKIMNSFSLNYPKEKLKFLFITDGSDDKTAQIISSYPEIKLLHEPVRMGKSAAINRAMEFVQTDLVVFCDANTELNKDCLLQLLKHFSHEKVGAVAGEKKIKTGRNQLNASGESFYWQYESFVKRSEAACNSLAGAAGELFAMRTKLFRPLEERLILDDLVISLDICRQGYSVQYEPHAFATETPSASIAEENKRRVRIAAGAFQSIGKMGSLLNPFVWPGMSFQLFSHRLLRWIFCPFALIFLLLSNMMIVIQTAEEFYMITLILQVIFYFTAFFTRWVLKQTVKPAILSLPYYISFMHLNVLEGLFRYLTTGQPAQWERSKRESFKTES